MTLFSNPPYGDQLGSVEEKGTLEGQILVWDNTNQIWRANSQILIDRANGISTAHYNTSYTPTGSEATGTTYWDSANGGVPATVLGNGVIGQHFLEAFITGQNDTGAQLNDGTPVAYAGSIGNSGNFRIKKAQALSTEPAFYFIGILTENIINGGTGKITTRGKVRGIQTNGVNYGESWSAGDIIYVSGTTAGYLTKTPPSAPTPAIPVALVISAHASNGTLEVRPTYPSRISMLSDVDGSDPTTTGDLLTWNQTSGVWERNSYNITSYSLVVSPDNVKTYWGTGSDMSIYYDGTSGYIKTDEVAASDLHITTGTAKTLVLDTVVYDDQQVQLGAIRVGSSSPTWTAYKGSEVLAFAKNLSNSITFNLQFSHRIKVDSTAEFHLHVVAPDNNSGGVRWQLTVGFANINGTFPTETTITATQTISANSQDKHLLFDLTDTLASNIGISGIALCSLTRLGTDGADTYDNDIYLVALDSHFQIDTQGSRLETAK